LELGLLLLLLFVAGAEVVEGAALLGGADEANICRFARRESRIRERLRRGKGPREIIRVDNHT
jgi:hypothetical protein